MPNSPNLPKKRFRFIRGEKVTLPFNVSPEIQVLQPTDYNLLSWCNFYLKKDVMGIESIHTARAKQYDLYKLYKYCKYRGCDIDIRIWDKALLSAFVTELEKVYEIPTVYRVFATITNFVGFLILNDVILPKNNPVRGIPMRTQELPPPQGIQAKNERSGKSLYLSSDDMYARLLSAAQELINLKRDPTIKNRARPYRDAAITALLYCTGLRVDELCGLTMSQMDRDISEGMWLRNVHCKGKITRKVFVKEDAVKILLEYIDKERGNNEGVIFQSWRGKRLNQPDISRIVKEIAARAALKLPPGTVIDIHPHSFRHERGYKLKQANLGDAYIANQLGHRGLEQVARYSRRSEEDEVKLLKDI